MRKIDNGRFYKGKPMKCLHDRDTNKWFLIQSWKKTHLGYEAVNPIDITEAVAPQIGSMGDYVRRVENMAINLLSELMTYKNIPNTDENMQKMLDLYDEQANEQNMRPSKLVLKQLPTGRFSFVSDSFGKSPKPNEEDACNGLFKP